MRILLAMDESSPSTAAFEELQRRSWPPLTVVRVLHVVDKFVPPAAQLWYDAGGSLSASRAAVIRHYEEIVGRIADELRVRGLQTEWTVCEGNPHEEIVKSALEWNADLIVVGSHCYTGLKRLFLRSVAQSVINGSNCPVEVVPERSKKQNDS